MNKSTLQQTAYGWDWLTAWVNAWVNDDWEHGDGVKIETLDNPGWMINIDTLLQDSPYTFDAILETTENDNYFFNLSVKNGKIYGCADLTQIDRLIRDVCRILDEMTSDHIQT